MECTGLTGKCGTRKCLPVDEAQRSKDLLSAFGANRRATGFLFLPHAVGAVFSKEALIKSARADGERFCFQARF